MGGYAAPKPLIFNDAAAFGDTRTRHGHDKERDMDGDHLLGWKAIGDHLGIGPDAARHLHRDHGLPAFKIGTKKVAASKASIRAWLAEREAAARARQPGSASDV